MTDSHESEQTRTPIAEHDAAVARHKRLVLTAAAVTFLAFMAYPVVTSFTGALDGVVHGIGVAYAVGLAVILAPVAGAIAYRRWAARLDEGARR